MVFSYFQEEFIGIVLNKVLSLVSSRNLESLSLEYNAFTEEHEAEIFE